MHARLPDGGQLATLVGDARNMVTRVHGLRRDGAQVDGMDAVPDVLSERCPRALSLAQALWRTIPGAITHAVIMVGTGRMSASPPRAALFRLSIAAGEWIIARRVAAGRARR